MRMFQNLWFRILTQDAAIPSCSYEITPSKPWWNVCNLFTHGSPSIQGLQDIITWLGGRNCLSICIGYFVTEPRVRGSNLILVGEPPRIRVKIYMSPTWKASYHHWQSSLVTVVLPRCEFLRLSITTSSSRTRRGGSCLRDILSNLCHL